ncbi:aminoacyl-tRNA deacylase [Enterovibrio norvegicus]|uniref:aminoacyl-tRNA deacylase n=1 Tax=Enterovibrio norvegicus TaxID=188144 RepID=UPI0024B1CA7A|nr:YbaK/EbsC family protein [Enterovibrio norvegicus]
MTDFDTPILSVLRYHEIAHRILPHETEATTIADAAQQRGVDPRQMVKSMLMKDMGGNIVLACVPGTSSVDPNKVRDVMGLRRMTCVESKHVISMTGYAPGMVTPVAVNQMYPIIFDAALSESELINISSGSPMAGVEMAYQDLVELCTPIVADIRREDAS